MNENPMAGVKMEKLSAVMRQHPDIVRLDAGEGDAKRKVIFFKFTMADGSTFTIEVDEPKKFLMKPEYWDYYDTEVAKKLEEHFKVA